MIPLHKFIPLEISMYIKEIAHSDKASLTDIKERKIETDKLLSLLLTIYDQKTLAKKLNSQETGLALKELSREKLNAWKKNPSLSSIIINASTITEIRKALLPEKPSHWEKPEFTFIDLFAGIGGLRKGFEEIGGKCVFTCEWDNDARKTYLANFFVDDTELPYFVATERDNPQKNKSFMDITKITKSKESNIEEDVKREHILKHIPEHDVLLAGFPCQPFSLAGVSKKNSLGRAHGFDCTTQGTLFFDIEKVLEARKPKFFVLENVKNLKSHDKGRTFATIIRALDQIGYFLTDISNQGSNIEESIAIVKKRKNEPIIIDGAKFTPQHRERVVLIGIRKDLAESNDEYKRISLSSIEKHFPKSRLSLSDILVELKPDDRKKYTLTENLWNYLYHYALKHQSRGNGFGFGLVDPKNLDVTTRTLSARYYKDGSEILINQHGLEEHYLEKNKCAAIRKNKEREDYAVKYAESLKLTKNDITDSDYKALLKEGEKSHDGKYGRYSKEFDPSYKTPRRLTPKECARLMGFEKPEKLRRSTLDKDFRIVCSDSKAYKQFGNSVVVPVFKAVANILAPYLQD